RDQQSPLPAKKTYYSWDTNTRDKLTQAINKLYSLYKEMENWDHIVPQSLKEVQVQLKNISNIEHILRIA
ncbi:2316_t:CDS:1, partial [Acaulospora colombiana]